MPPPVTVCSICNKEVLKARTYHIGAGKRACKEHEGVLEAKDQLDLKLIQKKKDERAAHEAREEAHRQRMRECDPSYWSTPRCWCCKATGIREQEFYFKLVIYSELQKLKGEWLNPLSPAYPQQIRAALGVKEGEVLHVIGIYPVSPTHPVLKRLDYNSRTASQFGGVVALCPKCAKHHNVEKPMMKFDLTTAVCLYDMVSPIFQAVAKVALDKEAQHN